MAKRIKAGAFYELIDSNRRLANVRIMLKSAEFIDTKGVVESMDKYVKGKFNDGEVEGHLDGRVNLEYHWLLLLKKSHIRSVALSLITHYSLLITLYYHYTSADF